MADHAQTIAVSTPEPVLGQKKPVVQIAEVADEKHAEEQNDAEQEQLTARQLLCFWDAVTHCAEPEHYVEITKMLEEAVKQEEQDASNGTQPAIPVEEAPVAKKEPKTKVMDEFEREFMSDRYQIAWTKDGKPERHPAWSSDFCLIVTEEAEQEPYFQVFKSEAESLIIDTTNPKPTSEAYPEFESDPARLVYQFGRKYALGPSAREEDGTPKIGLYSQVYNFNYAEHRILGDRLRLKFSDSETVVAGDRKLTLENGTMLTYGQVNGLGGDFFATNNPICTGSNFDQQCQYFMDAYNLLGKAETGRKEASTIDSINAKETQAVRDAIAGQKSTKQAYKDMSNNDKGSVSFIPVTKTDELLTGATMERDGPSYARMALLNLDHFGDDAHTAYNAGHTCAMRTAAAGNLEIAYAMNAFADHYLGDCFASGHIRTPRRKLHASGEAIDNVCKALNDLYQEVCKGVNAHSKTDAFLTGMKAPAMLSYLSAKILLHTGDIAAIAPDACSKFMHDEDNIRGLTVVNQRGDRWAAFGDTKLFEPENALNVRFMKEALQASADEVYQAYVTKHVPTDVNSFAAWRIAPSSVDEAHSHKPLFRSDGWYRTEWTKPWSSDYSDPKSWKPKSFWKPMSFPDDYPNLLRKMSGDDYFKNL
ncbi:uncharacterized protein N0V89_007829 [Didymosphaeria variabile]|uniref:Uncharacterized protein n=1 Tax=Didymosphaeria variabile TaxID=1932322 RepID=A0A9W9CB54_9PLEO|nr:uncharacterized protein N0V89_007829 [Didymosphaeria variabile]KAJ4352481.1 hypothetical protein N0V89_007829 [Didymosphaeria variabile]